MADSTISALAEVSSVAPTDVVPLVSGSTTYKATITKVADGVLDADAFAQSGTGADTRVILDKMREWVTPYDFGAVGDGVTDDTTALTNALATGKTVVDPVGGTFKITGGLSIATSGQRIVGAGPHKTAFTPNGSFDLFSVTGTYGCGVENIYIDGTNQSGGTTIKVSGANRTRFMNIKTASAYNFAYVTNANSATFRDIYCLSNRGSYSFKLYGPGSTRSDGVILDHVICSANTTDKPVGLDWDGFVHSVWIYGGGFLSTHSKGVWMRNAASGSFEPNYLNAFSLSLENCEAGFVMDAGNYVNLHNPYISLISAGSGISVAGGLSTDAIEVFGGIIANCSAYGVSASANQVQVMGTRFTNNTSGNLSNAQRMFTPGIRLDSTAYWELPSGSNPLMAFDGNDFMQYNRTSNLLSVTIGGTATAIINASGLRLPTLPTSASGLSSGQLWNNAGVVNVVP